ncbi:MAG: hypothetical protein QM791_13940 [Ferruginibacter sp.]
MLKYILVAAVLLYSCQSKKDNSGVPVSTDTIPLSKEQAEKELKEIRAGIKDSGFAAMMDASLFIQRLEASLQKADSTRRAAGFSESLVVNNPDGGHFYELMMKVYRLGLQQADQPMDINYFKGQLGYTKENWLSWWFKNKKTYEALISFHLLQKDIATTSMIVNGGITEQDRSNLEQQYAKGIKGMEEQFGK